MADQPPPPYSGVNAPSEETKSPLPPDAPSVPETTLGYPPQPVAGQPPPPQVAYPPSGYPLQQTPGYPPEQAGYPPQQGGYPPQPAGAPPPGYQPQKGYPAAATGYPPQGHGYVQQPGGYTASNTTNTVVVTQQPQITAIIPTYVNDYMGLSIFTCFFCCWCLGLFAIIKSSESRSFSNAGNYPQAVASATTARNLGYSSLICGLVIYVIIIIGAMV